MTTARIRSISALLLVMVAGVAQTAAAQLTPEQVTTLRNVSSVAMSPDGRNVAYVVSLPRAQEEDTTAGARAYAELWVVPTAGGAPRAIVQRPATAGGPAAWSADGSQIAYVLRSQIHIMPAGGGTARTIATATPVIAIQWSPDGKHLAYTSRVPEAASLVERRRRGDDVVVASLSDKPVQLFVQAVDGGAARAVTPANNTVRDFTWSPTGGMLAVQLTETSDADADLVFRKLYVVTMDGTMTLLPTQGKLGSMAWSPDGTRLAYAGATTLSDPLAQSVFVRSHNGVALNLTPNYEGSVTHVSWQDARTVRFVANEGTKTAINTVPATGGSITRVLGHGPEIFSAVSYSRDGASFALAANTALHPNEVFVGTMKDKRLRRITNHNEWLANVQLGRQETIEYTARDGWRIEGVVIHPVGSASGSRAPLAILPHGGPEGINSDGWNTNSLYPAQVLAGQGYVIFMPNYRGSGGRGVAFSKGDHRDLAGKEFEDVLDGIDALSARGVIDAQRVGISGTSYGGYFSAWAGTKYSDRFRLAMPFAGISNWLSFMGTTDIPRENALVHWDLWPYDHPLLMHERSPVAHIANAKTPMILGSGLADERVPPTQMIELHAALKLKGVPTELVLYPREPHGLLERQHQLDYMRRIVEAFNKYVRPGSRPTT